MSIELTPNAAARMRDFLARHPQAAGVRFGIKRTGCSGFGYTVDLADEVKDTDKVFDLDGVRLVVEAKALLQQTPPKPLEVVAEEAGFQSMSTFHSAFKKQEDITPAAFRAANANS